MVLVETPVETILESENNSDFAHGKKKKKKSKSKKSKGKKKKSKGKKKKAAVGIGMEEWKFNHLTSVELI